jgi:small conductance mechanosensitive channel
VLASISEIFALYGVRVAVAIALVLAAWWVSGRLRALVVEALQQAHVDVTLARFGGNLAKWALLLLAAITALGAVGIETVSLAAVLGGASVALGLAFKDSLSNFAAGLLLLVFRPFRAGDTITVAGVTGRVFDIEMFVTRIDTPDNRRVIVPNGTVFKANIENATAHPTRRVDVTFKSAKSSDVDETRARLQALADAVDGRVADRPAEIVLTDVVGDDVLWVVSVWTETERYADVRQALLRALVTAA